MMNKSSVVQRTKVYVFSDYVLCLGKIHENPQIKHCMGTKIGVVQNITRNTETWTELMVSQWNSSGISSQGFDTLQLSQEVQELLLR